MKKTTGGALAVILFLIGITACQKAETGLQLTGNEQVAADFFQRIYYEKDEKAAKKLVTSVAKEDPFVESLIEVGADFAKESPVEKKALKVLTVERRNIGDVVLVYHPKQTLFLVVKGKKIRMAEEKTAAWDVLNDELDQDYPGLKAEWKEVAIQ